MRRCVVVLWCVAMGVSWLSSAATEGFSDSTARNLLQRSSTFELELAGSHGAASSNSEHDTISSVPGQTIRAFRWVIDEISVAMGFQRIGTAIRLLLGPGVVWSSTALTQLLPGACVGVGFVTVPLGLAYGLIKRSIDS